METLLVGFKDRCASRRQQSLKPWPYILVGHSQNWPHMYSEKKRVEKEDITLRRHIDLQTSTPSSLSEMANRARRFLGIYSSGSTCGRVEFTKKS